RADEGAVLDTGDVGRIGEGDIGIGTLRVGKTLEGALVDQQLTQTVILSFGAVAPIDRIRLGQSGDIFDPGLQALMLRRSVSYHHCEPISSGRKNACALNNRDLFSL